MAYRYESLTCSMVLYSTSIVDGFSRLPVVMECTDNKKADTILSCFMKDVNEYGLPSHGRSDL